MLGLDGLLVEVLEVVIDDELLVIPLPLGLLQILCGA